MRYTKWYRVNYQGRPRLDTLNQDEAENYARALWARDSGVGSAPTLDEYDIK